MASTKKAPGTLCLTASERTRAILSSSMRLAGGPGLLRPPQLTPALWPSLETVEGDLRQALLKIKLAMSRAERLHHQHRVVLEHRQQRLLPKR